MGKIARLHDGNVLEFPDATPDEAIDATVAAHHAQQDQNAQNEKEQDATNKDVGNRQHKQFHQEKMQYHQQRDAQSDQRQERRDMVQHQQLQHTVQTDHQKIQQHGFSNQILTHLAQSMAQLNENMTRMAEGMQVIGKLAQSVEQLTQTVQSSTDKIIEVLSADKDLVFDARGRPTGTKRKMQKQEPDMDEGA